MALAILDHFNPVRDKDVSSWAPESAKAPVFYVFFIPRHTTLWDPKIKPGVLSTFLFPYLHTLLGPSLQYLKFTHTQNPLSL